MPEIRVDALADVLAPALERWTAEDGRDYHALKAEGQHPGIGRLARESGLSERSLRRILCERETVDCFSADRLLEAAGRTLLDVPGFLEGEPEIPAYSDQVLTVAGDWKFREL